MENNLTLKRRGFLVGSASALAAAGFGAPVPIAAAQEAKPLPDYVAWKNAGSLIVHSDKTLETKRGEIGAGIITPADRLYIRNNVNVPDDSIVADRDGWMVEFAGVKEPRSISVGELKTLGVETVAAVLQCSGNGRAYFEHKPSGTPWTVGAAGCVLWSGVPLKAVIEAMGGAVEGTRFVTGTGGEVIPEGLDPKDLIVERSVPAEALESIILAWEMNGAPVPLAHGGPLRMIVPGYTGVNNIKYVKKVALTENETDAKIQATRYRIYPVGGKASTSDPSVWKMEVKSWITSPLEVAKAGKVQVTGVAFGGFHAVSSVEVSADGGETWKKADFVGPDLGRYAWRPFVISLDLPAGRHTLVSRATDSEGKSQPREFEPNQSGYSHNGWLAHGVTVDVA
ncbi:sulfite oxidase [Aestuariivirga sp.]|uniref:SorT family sulfite dehydrogenase catalytic subunit n=1 Tax=Aestuariivirga sp. TaxID=2650926 RepID=UPI00391A09BA